MIIETTSALNDKEVTELFVIKHVYDSRKGKLIKDTDYNNKSISRIMYSTKISIDGKPVKNLVEHLKDMRNNITEHNIEKSGAFCKVCFNKTLQDIKKKFPQLKLPNEV
tara:strand:- start:209 stop:535 length:327 start_codon:yes stop_codon:yes gene_type:complete